MTYPNKTTELRRALYQISDAVEAVDLKLEKLEDRVSRAFELLDELEKDLGEDDYEEPTQVDALTPFRNRLAFLQGYIASRVQRPPLVEYINVYDPGRCFPAGTPVRSDAGRSGVVLGHSHSMAVVELDR